MAGNITSANATLILSCPLYLPVPQQIQEYGLDDMVDVADVERIETRMGADGGYAAGFIPMPRETTITLLPSSPSVDFFDQLNAMETVNLTPGAIFGTLTLTGVGTSYTMINGYMVRYSPLANVKKTLQDRKFMIRWQNITYSPVGIGG